nr:unnamed protein product [Digitaria exilis]
MPRRPAPLPGSRRRGAGEPPPGLFPDREDLLRLLSVLAIATAAAAACSLLNRRTEPFCDSPLQPPHDYAGGDSCQPCPHNGRCVEGKLECVQGFKRHGTSCLEDGLLSQTATKISELLQLRICDQHARALCGLPAKILFQKHEVLDTVDHLLSKNPAGLNEDGIQLVKVRVLNSAQGFFETAFTSNKAEAFRCPELVAERHRPLTCQVRQWISRNIIFVTTFCIMVCEILEDNAVNAKIGNSDCEPWVVASWLRDHLLVPRERKNAFLWKKLIQDTLPVKVWDTRSMRSFVIVQIVVERVEELILEDSRIDQYPKVIKGESKVVYEWQASGSLKTKKVQGARVKTRTGGGGIKLAEEMGEARLRMRSNLLPPTQKIYE